MIQDKKVSTSLAANYISQAILNKPGFESHLTKVLSIVEIKLTSKKNISGVVNAFTHIKEETSSGFRIQSKVNNKPLNNMKESKTNSAKEDPFDGWD